MRVKKGHNKDYKKKETKRRRSLVRLLEIRLLLDGLLDDFRQFQAVHFVRKGSSCKDRRRG